MLAQFVGGHPFLAALALLGAFSALVSIAFLVVLGIFELERSIQTRRARRARGGEVDLVGVRPS